MTSIKKILNKQGNEVFIRTSTKAVVDGNGYTAESRLQAMQDEINAAQLEIGAVPSDLTPTENSTNWVMSGGLYNMKEQLDTKIEYATYYSNKQIDLEQYFSSLTSRYINLTENKWKTLGTSRSFTMPVSPNEKYKIIGNADAHSRYTLLASDEIPSTNITPDYATGESLHSLQNGEEVIFTVPSDAVVMYIQYELSDVDVLPQYVGLYQTIKEAVKVLEDKVDNISAGERQDVIYSLTLGKIVDARTSSQTFGSVISATNNDWGISQWIPVNGKKYVTYYANITSGSTNYAGITGTVFYDADKTPLTTGARTIINSSPSSMGWISTEIPEGAYYMRVGCTVSNNGSTTQFIKLYSLSSQDIFDNSVQEAGISYYGEKIKFDNSFSYKTFSSGSASGQSSAIYGDYLFIVKDKLTNVICYNMAKRAILYNLATGLSKDATWHCNQCQFGTLKYSQDDMFPVLYITVNNNAQGRCSWVAYRIIPTLTDGEISSFEIVEVQTIKLPVMTDNNALGNVNIAVDTERNLLWGYGRNNNSNADNSQLARFVCFPMPQLTESEVIFEDSDIIDTFSNDWKMSYAQGGFIKNGKLVFMQGYSNVGHINMRVIDLYAQKKQVSFVELFANGFTEEPEGVFYWNGHIYTSANSSNIWEFTFK